jgi:hypothetical protein
MTAYITFSSAILASDNSSAGAFIQIAPARYISIIPISPLLSRPEL